MNPPEMIQQSAPQTNSTLSETLKHSLLTLTNIPDLLEVVKCELITIASTPDTQFLLQSLHLILESHISDKSSNDQLINQFSHFFQQLLLDRASSKEIDDWPSGLKDNNNTASFRSILIQVHQMRVEARNKDAQIDILTERAAQLDQILSRIDTEIQIIEEFAFGERQAIDDYENQMPHLCRVAQYLAENTLSQDQSDILQEMAAKSEWLLSHQDYEHYEIQQFCESIEHLTHRFTHSPNALLNNICMLLKVEMHLVQSLAKSKQSIEQHFKKTLKDREARMKKDHQEKIQALSQEVTQKLMAMQNQTALLVKQLSRNNEQHSELKVDDTQEVVRNYESEINSLKRLVAEHEATINSMLLLKDQFILRQESLRSQITMIQAENTNLRKASESENFNAFRQYQITRLQNELANLHSNIQVLSQNELQDHIQIERLSLLLAEHQREQLTSRKQLEELIRQYKEHPKAELPIVSENCSEEVLTQRIKQLEEEVEVCNQINATYAIHQKDIEHKLGEFQQQNERLNKEISRLRGQAREVNRSLMRDIFLDGNSEQQESSIRSETIDFQAKQKALNDKVMVLTLTLETVKAKYMEQIRKRAAVRTKLEEIDEEHGQINDERVELFIQNKTLQDENRSLMQTQDRANSRILDLEKRYRKLAKQCSNKSLIIDQLQLQIRDLSQGRDHGMNTQRTVENIVRRRGGSHHIKTKSELTLENQELRQSLEKVKEDREFYLRAIKDEVINGTKSRVHEMDLTGKDQKVCKTKQTQIFRVSDHLEPLNINLQSKRNSVQKSDKKAESLVLEGLPFEINEGSVVDLINLLQYIQQLVVKTLQSRQNIDKIDQLKLNLAMRDFSANVQTSDLSGMIGSLLQTVYSGFPHSANNTFQLEKVRSKIIEAVGWGRLRELIGVYIKQQKPETLSLINQMITI